MLKRLLIVFLSIFFFTAILNHGKSFFQKDLLSFDADTVGTTGFRPSTPNLTKSATRIIGGLALEDGTIISGKYRTLLDYATPMIGAIMPVAVTSNARIPIGWLACDGSEVSINVYPTLYKYIGTNWGNAVKAGSFKLPNLANAFIRGRDPRGNAGGREVTSRNVGNLQGSAIHSHEHTITGATSVGGGVFSLPIKSTSSGAAHAHTLGNYRVPRLFTTEEPDNEGSGNVTMDKIATSGPFGPTGVGVFTDSHVHTITPSGATSATGNAEMIPRSIYMIYCIKATPY